MFTTVVNSDSNHTNKLRCVEQISMTTNNQTVSSNNNICRSYLTTKCKTKQQSNPPSEEKKNIQRTIR